VAGSKVSSLSGGLLYAHDLQSSGSQESPLRHMMVSAVFAELVLVFVDRWRFTQGVMRIVIILVFFFIISGEWKQRTMTIIRISY
jgi:hypothetical protein